MKRSCWNIGFATGLLALVACMETPQIYDPGAYGSGQFQNGKADASAIAVFLDFEFDSELVTTSCFNPRSAIDQQLLYTVGQLNGQNSVGRLDRLEVSNVQKEDLENGCRISYHARIPVAWGKRNDVPHSYEFFFPKDVSHQGTARFMESYEHGCLDWGAHDVTAGIFWYYYRPEKSSCTLNDDDIVTATASVSPSVIHTTGKYPEYHKIWEDDVFEVVAIFGKNEEGAGNGDVGVTGYNNFVRDTKNLLDGSSLSTEPSHVPNTPGVDMPAATLSAEFEDGRRVKVSVFLIDSVGSATSEFWDQYETLTPTADFIVYNGHSGLGANIRKLARKGVWQTGQYAVVFMNGCDTYAYVDSALADAHAAVNSDDENGSKYVDIVANAMPSLFYSMPKATMALVEGLMDRENPRTFEKIFERVDRSEVVLVTGEHDNVYYPGYTGYEMPTMAWEGINEQGSLAQGESSFFQTPTLPQGRYRFEMTGEGDADLYVRLGESPTTELFDCRPFLDGTDESCEVDLDNPAPIFIMVHANRASTYRIVGTSIGNNVE
jgi:hypothetical protein